MTEPRWLRRIRPSGWSTGRSRHIRDLREHQRLMDMSMREPCWRTSEEGRRWQAALQEEVTGVDVVNHLLAQAAESARVGRKAIDRSVNLTRQAFTFIPVGAVLRFDPAPPAGEYQIRKTEPGWDDVDSGRDVDAAWVEEWWSRGALRIASPAPGSPS